MKWKVFLIFLWPIFLLGEPLERSKARQAFSVIINTQQAIIQEETANGTKVSDLVFLCFFNFDRTILNGDTTDGGEDIYGRKIFEGLAQKAIENGFSQQYSSQHGFSQYWKDYQKLKEKDEPTAYAYAAQILAGSKKEEVLRLSTEYFESTLKDYLFPTSLELIEVLKNHGIEVHVITASPKIFVQGAAKILGLSLNQFSGMETVEQNGVLTDQMVLPLTTRQGKVDKILQIVENYKKQNKKVYVLAGFGNNNFNDMVFLTWIAKQKLPQGNSMSLISYIPPNIQHENFFLVPLGL